MSNGPDLLEPPVSLADAARDERDSRMRLDRYARDYDRARTSASPAAIARARAEWGLAIYERIQALVAYAAAEDRQNATRRGGEAPRSGAASHPARQQGTDHAEPGAEITTVRAKEILAAAHAHADACWRAYHDIRQTADPAGTERARSDWEHALAAWIRATIAHAEKQDGDTIAARQHARDQAAGFHPGDAFPRGRAKQPAAGASGPDSQGECGAGDGSGSITAHPSAHLMAPALSIRVSTARLFSVIR
jgi:hypothetical protein